MVYKFTVAGVKDRGAAAELNSALDCSLLTSRTTIV